MKVTLESRYGFLRCPLDFNDPTGDDRYLNPNAQQWEEWTVEDQAEGCIALRSTHGTYLRFGDTGEVNQSRTADAWQQFTRRIVEPGVWSLSIDIHDVVRYLGSRLHPFTAKQDAEPEFWVVREVGGTTPPEPPVPPEPPDPPIPPVKPPEPPDPGPRPPNGMTHSVAGGRGAVLYSSRSDWYSPSTYIRMSLGDISRFCSGRYQEDMTHLWQGLSTGRRREMREEPFNFLRDKNRVLDRLDHTIERCGKQPIIEMGTQEFLAQELGGDQRRILDYVEEAAEHIGRRCKIAFVHREWGDHRDASNHRLYTQRDIDGTGKPNNKARVELFNERNKALRRGLNSGRGGSGVRVGVHTRSAEMPPVGLFTGVGGKIIWLAHFKFSIDVTQPFEHDDIRGATAGDWFRKAIENRLQAIGGRLEVAMFEHSISPEGDNYGRSQGKNWHRGGNPMNERNGNGGRFRGDHFMRKAPKCIADFSAGGTRG